MYKIGDWFAVNKSICQLCFVGHKHKPIVQLVEENGFRHNHNSIEPSDMVDGSITEKQMDHLTNYVPFKKITKETY